MLINSMLIYVNQNLMARYNLQRLDNYLWRRKWQPTPVLLPGESHGGRSLVGYSPWGGKESDRTEQPHFHFDNCLRMISCKAESEAGWSVWD